MKAIEELIESSRKIVVKIGSHAVSDEAGHVNREAMRSIVDQMNQWMKRGKRVIIVSSGAGICGIAAINKWRRKDDIHYKQALCSIGQVELMMLYKEFFAEHGIHVGQILLSADDFEDPVRNLHIRNTLFTLVDEGVVPIINENDSVSVDEIKIGDNDTLSALTANLWGADLLILLSDINGIYDKNPKIDPEARLIQTVMDIDRLEKQIDMNGTSAFGTGGAITKIAAARSVNRMGIPMIMANGTKMDILSHLESGQETGTVFLP